MNGLLENWGILWPLPTISMLVVMRARSIKEQKNGASFAWQREDYDSCAATTCKSMQEGSQASIGYHLWFWHLFLHKLVGKPSQLVNFMTAFRLIQDSCCCDSASAAMQPIDRTEWNIPEQCHGVPLHPRALKQWESKLSFYNIIMNNRKSLPQTCISRSINEEAM